MYPQWIGAIADILRDPLVLLAGLLALAYGADRLFHAEGRLLPVMILAVAPPIGWLSGYDLPVEIRSLGLVMFLYVVGLEAGSTFFPTFRKHWLRFIALGVLAGAISASVAWAFGHVHGWSAPETAAFYAGSVTSTPAFEALLAGPGELGVSLTRTFDLSYFMGVLWAVLAVVAIHLAWTRNGSPSPRTYSAELDEADPEAPLYVSVHRCENRALAGQPMEQSILRGVPHSQVVRYARGGSVRQVSEADAFKAGDLVALVSPSHRLTELAEVFVGPRVEVPADDPLVIHVPVQLQTVTVSAGALTRERVSLEEIEDKHGIEVRGWWRGREYFAASPLAAWRPGDKLRVLGTPERVRAFRYVAEEKDRRQAEETDLLRFSVGAIVALFLSAIALPVGFGVRLSTGMTGGALLAGLVFGRSARMLIPRGAGFFIKELGLGLFLAGVGTSVGVHGPPGLNELSMLPAALLTIGLPAVVTAAVLRRAGLTGPYVSGGVCGTLTSTPALIVATRLSESTGPVATYAGIYLFALLGSVAAAQILVVLG